MGDEFSKVLSAIKNLKVPPRLYRQAEYDVCIHEIKTSEIFKYMTKILRYIIPAIVGREVGLANLEAEFCNPTLLEEITAPIYMTLVYHVNHAGL